MSYIAPNSTIILLGNVPLDKTYDHTIRWGSLSSQTSYFVSSTTHNLNRHVLSNQSYQRVNKNTLKVEYTVADISAHGSIYSYNYLAFKNTSFENKYFYAFIDRVDYVNNNVYEITYEIDVMQTWYFDYDVNEVFVERENVKDDTIGNNLVDENIDIGDYVLGYGKFEPLLKENASGDVAYFVLITTVIIEDGEVFQNIRGKLYNYTVYSGLNYLYFTTINDVNEAINTITSAVGAEAIIGIYEIPAQYKDQLDPSQLRHHASFEGNYIYTGDTTTNKTGEEDIMGYIPINKKLLTYPYNCLLVSNNTGITNIYRYEFFPINQVNNKRSIHFHYYANAIGGFTSVYVPRYKNATLYYDNDYDFSQAIKIDGTQMCDWANDFWKAYKAQNLNRMVVEGIGASADLALSITATGAMVASGVGGTTLTAMGKHLVSSANNYGGLLAKIDDYKRLPPTAHIGSDVNTLYINQKIGLNFHQQCITRKYAERIDRYFSKFGYPVKDVKIPAVFTNSRCDHWNFIQTVGCTLTGSVPNDDLNNIATIYDKGITFWENPDYIGNYSHYSWKCDSSR